MTHMTYACNLLYAIIIESQCHATPNAQVGDAGDVVKIVVHRELYPVHSL